MKTIQTFFYDKENIILLKVWDMDSTTQSVLEKHLELVLEANKITNLTRIDSFDEGKKFHIEDSLTGLEELNKAPEGRYADIGCGAGYPGIPLAVTSGRETLLVDSVGKKTAVLDTIIKELDLSSVSTYHGRIEDLAKEQPQSFAVITARALSQLSILMEFASPLLIKGGYLICYKSNLEDEEFTKALSLEKTLGMKLVSRRDFELYDKHRCIVVFEKVSKPTIKLPRKTGFAQKKPL